MIHAPTTPNKELFSFENTTGVGIWKGFSSFPLRESLDFLTDRNGSRPADKAVFTYCEQPGLYSVGWKVEHLVDLSRIWLSFKEGDSTRPT